MSDERKPDYIYSYSPEYAPQAMWVTRDGHANPYSVQMSTSQENADRGMGALVPTSNIIPYTSEMWERVNEFFNRRKQIIADLHKEYKELMKGQFRLL